MQDLCILIPTINRKDLLMKALESYSEVMPEVTKLILDNGNQDCMRDWAEQTNNLYHRSDNNLGTTGGYNWFIRVGE